MTLLHCAGHYYSSDRRRLRALCHKANHFTVVNIDYTGPWLQCLMVRFVLVMTEQRDLCTKCVVYIAWSSEYQADQANCRLPHSHVHTPGTMHRHGQHIYTYYDRFFWDLFILAIKHSTKIITYIKYKFCRG